MSTPGPGIFISYRRRESLVQARAVYERLRAEFGAGSVFIDLEGLDYGVDFEEVLKAQLDHCAVLLAMIGPQWLTSDDGAGGRRLDDENDFVRIELRTALRRAIRVVPVLVDGAAMPRSAELPEDIRSLARRQGLELDFRRFDADMGRLVATLRRILSAAAAPAPAPVPDTSGTVLSGWMTPPGRLVGLAGAVIALLALVWIANRSGTRSEPASAPAASGGIASTAASSSAAPAASKPAAPTAAASGDELVVRIGHVAPITGALAYLGSDNENGARLAIDELNAAGVTIGGRKTRLVLIAMNDANDPKLGIAAAQTLVGWKVSGVVGHLNSITSIPASKVYADAGIPQITPSTKNARFTRNGYKTSFRVIADDSQVSIVLARHAVTVLKARVIAGIDDRSSYGVFAVEAFVKAAEAAGATVVGSQSIPDTIPDKAGDFSAVLNKLKAARPDGVFFGGMGAVAGPLIRQMKQAGIGARLIGGEGMCSNDLPSLAGGSIADGQVICGEAGGADEAQKAALDRFRAAYRRKFDADAGPYAPYAYDATRLMVAAMVKAGSADPASYLPVLAGTTGYKGVTGSISFDEKGDIRNGASTLYTYKGGARERIGVVR